MVHNRNYTSNTEAIRNRILDPKLKQYNYKSFVNLLYVNVSNSVLLDIQLYFNVIYMQISKFCL
jgi:hypothetical protein